MKLSRPGSSREPLFLVEQEAPALPGTVVLVHQGLTDFREVGFRDTEALGGAEEGLSGPEVVGTIRYAHCSLQLESRRVWGSLLPFWQTGC
jgi:hypothetical protein